VSKKTLVLGLGNRLMTDDGAGLAALDLFGDLYELPPGVELLDGGTLGLELLVYIEGSDNVLIADCIMGRGREPGSVVRVEGSDVAAVFQKCLSPHQMGLKDIIAVLELQQATPERLTIVGIEGEVVELGTEMTPRVRDAVPGAVDMMAEVLGEWGIERVRKQP